MYCIQVQKPHTSVHYRRSQCQTQCWEREVPLIAISFKRCKTKTVSTKNCVKLPVCRANKQEQHILRLRCTEWLRNAAVNEHVNSRAERRNLGATELRGRLMIPVAQGIHFSPVSTIVCKTTPFTFAVPAGNPYSHF